MRMLSIGRILLATVGTAMLSTGAFAHAFLQTAEPAVGSTVAAAPSVIRIHFTEGVVPRFSGIKLATEAGAAIATGEAAVDADDKTVLSVKVMKPLGPGSYKVSWHAVATDTHRTEGSFTFSVR